MDVSAIDSSISPVGTGHHSLRSVVEASSEGFNAKVLRKLTEREIKIEEDLGKTAIIKGIEAELENQYALLISGQTVKIRAVDVSGDIRMNHINEIMNRYELSWNDVHERLIRPWARMKGIPIESFSFEYDAYWVFGPIEKFVRNQADLLKKHN